jgi:hypothetical protein
MKLRLTAITVGLASLAIVACQTSTSSPPATRTAMTHSVDTASIQRAQENFRSLTAQGYHYRFSGHLSDINFAMANGHAVLSGHAQPGDYLDVGFVKSPRTMFAIGPHAGRTAQALPPQCATCEFDGTPPPTGPATNPPNFGPCAAGGGATWFDESTGDGGCLGPGGSKGLPCGTWSWSSAGRGRFRSWDGTTDQDGWTFISVNSDGRTCHLGY